MNQTAIHIAVSQLAKMPFPTLKALSTKDLEVRKPQKTSFAYPPTQEAYSLFENIEPKKVTDFIALVKTMYPLYSVAFSTHHYLKNNFSNCPKQTFDLFLNLVQTFTLLHHQHRKTPVENVLAATNNDYEEAYKLWLCCQPKKTQPVYLPTMQRVLYFLQYKYNNKPFTANIIAAQLNYSNHYIGKILLELLKQKLIQLIHSPKVGTKIYQICKQ